VTLPRGSCPASGTLSWIAPDRVELTNGSQGRGTGGSVRRIARNTGAQIAADGIGKLALLVFYVVLARTVGKSDFGVFTLAISVVVVIEILGSGMDFIVIRGVAQRQEDVHHLFWNSLLVKVAVGLLGAGLGLGLGLIAGFGATTMATIALIAAAKIVDLAAGTIAATLRGIEQMVPVAFSLALQRISAAVLGCVALLVLGVGVVGVGLVYLLASVLALASLLVSIARREIRPRVDASLSAAQRLFIESIPLGISFFFVAILARADTVILSLFESTAVVGLYGAAYRLFEGTFFVTAAFGLAIFPVLSRLDRDSTPPLARAYELACKAVVAVLTPVGAAMVLFAPTIVTGVFGDSFGGAATATRFLGVAAAFYGPFAISGGTLAARGRPKPLAWMVGIAMVVNIALNLALIPVWSLDGAAAAMALTQVTLTGGIMALTIKEVGRISLWRVFLGPIAGSAGMCAVAVLLGDGVPALLVSAVAYAVALLAVERTLFRDDVTIAIDAFRRRGSGEGAEIEVAALETGQSL
jgi:O-antigen/teichoic acid export membrane protein